MEFDYIIIGAGSAGCVLANRLSANPARRVLLLEAGGRDWHPFLHMPAGISRVVSLKTFNWGYETEPQDQLNGRRLYWPRGRVLGGSSSINAMCYARGHRLDYDSWAAEGNSGWDYASVLPYFLKAEDQENGASSFHATGGPLAVQNLRHVNALSRKFLEAAREAGYAANDDFNGARQPGFGLYQVTQRNGVRCSTAAAYLRPSRGRSNLQVRTNALAESILFDGLRACGVRYSASGTTQIAHGGHIVVSAGTINSPQLLMLSGIGPADQLRNHRIRVQHDLAGVGKNLQDHLDICTLVSTLQPDTYDHLNDFLVGLRYLLGRNGPGSSNIAEAGGFLVSRYATDERPDIQMHFVPALLDDHGRNHLPGYGVTIHACVLHPESRGAITLRSADPTLAPAIQPRYLNSDYDRKVMIECVRLSRKIFAQPAFKSLVGSEIYPGSATTDDELLAFIREKAETIYHPVGTCRMGNDSLAVVDANLHVHGVPGLSVVDASIMPDLVSGNTNAPTIMIAEKFAACVAG